MVVGSIIEIASYLTAYGPIAILLRFIWWFYGTLIPFIVQYIGIPMFVLGIILALAFAGGTVIFIIVFCIVMFYFIKGTIFNSKPTVKV